MKRIRQLTTAILTILFSLASQVTSAQFMSVPTTFSTPGGNITTYQNVYMPYHYYGSQVVSRKHLFTVVLLNDTTFQQEAFINVNKKVNELKWKTRGSKMVVLPSETKEIFRIDANGGKIISGKAMDSCWIFLTDTGKIKTYSITSETDVPLIAYIQKGESGKILPLTADNLEPLVSENEKARALVMRGKLLKALKVYNKQ